MITAGNVYDHLCGLAPLELQMDFDNSGFLLGHKDAEVKKVLVALDITSEVIGEAIEAKAELIVSHHPIIFDPLKKLTDESLQAYQLEGLKEDFRKRFNPQAEEQARKEGRFTEYMQAKINAIGDLHEAKPKTQTDAPQCPNCGAAMVKRHDRHGRAFWGCSRYPQCQGSRPYSKI